MGRNPDSVNPDSCSDAESRGIDAESYAHQLSRREDERRMERRREEEEQERQCYEEMEQRQWEEEQHQQYCREQEQQQSASAEAQANSEAATGQVRTCRVCHCTDDNACMKGLHGACYWVEADLCSECKSESGESGG
jgi:hypothetical protein